MKRRRILAIAIGAATLVAPLRSFAQLQARKPFLVGMLERTSMTANGANLASFRQALRELGYTEGRHFVIEYRSVEGRDELYTTMAAELVRLNVDVIVTRGTPGTLAAMKATGVIPIIMTGVSGPETSGIITSLNRPGGNVTGLSTLNLELSAKRVELLRELQPKLARIAGLFNMDNAAMRPQWKTASATARSMGVEPQLFDVRRSEELEEAIYSAARQRFEGLVVGLDTLTLANRRLIVDLAAKQRLPAIYPSSEFVDAGGMMSYGPNFPDQYQRAAAYVDKIFKGAKAGDLPVEQPMTFELVINLKAAKALGIAIPPAIMVRANRVIE